MEANREILVLKNLENWARCVGLRVGSNCGFFGGDWAGARGCVEDSIVGGPPLAWHRSWRCTPLPPMPVASSRYQPSPFELASRFLIFETSFYNRTQIVCTRGSFFDNKFWFEFGIRMMFSFGVIYAIYKVLPQFWVKY